MVSGSVVSGVGVSVSDQLRELVQTIGLRETLAQLSAVASAQSDAAKPTDKKHAREWNRAAFYIDRAETYVAGLSL